MCILLKLDYEKSGVSILFFQNLLKRNLWSFGSTLGKRKVKHEESMLMKNYNWKTTKRVSSPSKSPVPVSYTALL